MSDNYSGAYGATEHLIKMAYRHIYFVSRPILTITSIAERLRGYQEAMGDYGLAPADPVLVGEANQELSMKEFPLSSDSEEYRALSGFLRTAPEPKAVLAMNDVMALNIMEIAQAEGIAIPGELSVFGFDNREFGASYRIPLTTVRQDAYRIGSESTRLILERIIHGTSESETIKIPVEMVIRDSVLKNPLTSG